MNTTATPKAWAPPGPNWEAVADRNGYEAAENLGDLAVVVTCPYAKEFQSLRAAWLSGWASYWAITKRRQAATLDA